MHPTMKSLFRLLRRLHSGRQSAADPVFKETTADTDTLRVWIITDVEEVCYAYQIGNFNKQWYQSRPTATPLGSPSQYIQDGARNVITFYHPIKIVTSQYRCYKRASECCSSWKMQ